MRRLVRLYPVAACAAILLFSNNVLSAGEKKLMHCFYFTPVEAASQADWDAFAKAKLRGGEKSVTGQFSAVVREYGACMEFDSAAALKTYTDHPAHKDWETIYSKVRQYGTTTFDIIGQ
jgi:hypothetical protein